VNTIKKALLVLGVVLAVGASATASASASGFVSEKYWSTASGSSEGNVTITTSFGTLACGGWSVSGDILQPSESITMGVTPSSCTIFGAKAPVAMNGCYFVFRPGAEIEPGYFGGVMDIGPPNCGPITVTSGLYGQLKIYPKTNLNSMTFSGPVPGQYGEVQATASINNLKYIGFGESTVKENGSLSGSWKLSGSPTKIAVVSKLPAGLSLTGQGGQAGNLPRFTAVHLPASLGGRAITNQVIKTTIGTITCKSATPGGTLSAATSDLAAQMAYSGCTEFGFGATVKMNSCSYVFHVANSGPPYTGSMELVCSKVGDAMVVEGMEGCNTIIPPQTIASASYENVGEGYNGKVTAKLSGTGIKWSGCGSSGSAATYSGTIQLEGLF
jgi:hypothetical protein